MPSVLVDRISALFRVCSDGQLKRELDMFAPFADVYIAMHDTTIDAIDGEAVRPRSAY